MLFPAENRQGKPIRPELVSPRLLLWARAFDEWLEEREKTCHPKTCKHDRTTWARLLKQCGKPPWELTTGDLEEHAEWMQAQGYANNTIVNSLATATVFFRWCEEKRIDAECEAGFNPAAGARRPSQWVYQGARLLSREETERLLATVRADRSELGKRDYAYLRTRLQTGVQPKKLLRLKWGQIEHDPAKGMRDGSPQKSWRGVRHSIRWREGIPAQRLEEEAWEAIREALEAGGRLAGMKPGDYVFAPLAVPAKPGTGKKAEDWQADKPQLGGELSRSLKVYGRMAGIEAGKAMPQALHWTAIRLRMETGASTEELKAFMDSESRESVVKYRLSKLPGLPAPAPAGVHEGNREEGEGDDPTKKGEQEEQAIPVRERRGNRFQPGDGLTHGLYARSQPPEAVQAVLKEDAQGVDEQIAALRTLARRLLERQTPQEGRQGLPAQDSRQAAQLAEAYSLAASRLGELVRYAQEQNRGEMERRSGEESWVEQVLEMVDRLGAEGEETVTSEQIRAKALESAGKGEAGEQRTREEIAGLRYVLRNVYRIALEASESGELIRLVEVYGMGCARLLRLLKVAHGEEGLLEAYLQAKVDQAIDEFSKEIGAMFNQP